MAALIESVAAVGTVGVRAVGTAAAALAGVVVELNGVQTLATGGGMVGVWMAFIGCLLLAACYLLGRETLRVVRRPAS